MSDSVIVAKLPTCDICKYEDNVPDVEAMYDMRTRTGQWANVCEAHFRSHTNRRLGTGFGQRYFIKGGN